MINISAYALKESLNSDSNVGFIDVRTIAEYNNEHIQGFENIPLDTLDKNSESLNKYTSIVFLCGSGVRSKKACAKLANFNGEIRNVEGGIESWKTARFDLIKAKKQSMSIFRQVQIIAGSGVVIGILLSQFQNYNFIYLSLFFGAGLVFSGVTNTCAMGLLLAKMPWNK